MNSFELNKIMGAILGTCLGLLSLNIVANALFHPSMPAKPGYAIEVPEKPKAGQKQAPAQPDQPIEQVLASADVGRGKASFNKCTSCHTAEKNGKSTTGPNLYGVVGRKKASVEGFNYSAAFRKLEGNWTVEEISEFIKNPRAKVPGTNMTFAGVPRISERADLIAFLNSHSDNPQTFTKAAEAPSGDQPK